MKKLLAICVACISLVCLGYLSLAYYYRDGFALNTWINGVYCTGKTVEEVNDELLALFETTDTVTVVGYDASGVNAAEKSWTISLRETDIKADYTEGLKAFLARQNPLFWADNLTFHTKHDLQPAISFAESSLKEIWEEMIEPTRGEAEYRIDYSRSEGYSFYDGLRNLMDEEKAYQMLVDAIVSGQEKVDFIEAGCYYDAVPTKEQLELAFFWRQIEEFQENGPILDLGDGEMKMDPGTMAGFLEKDERAPYLPFTDDKGYLQIADGAAEAFVQKLVDEYSTQEKEWEFQSTRGDIVKVKGDTYGTLINAKSETTWLSVYLEELRFGRVPDDADTPHIPKYTKEAFHRSAASLGDTYIEIDLGEQKLYYYEGGELKFETNVVTGDERKKMSTPEGVNYVYFKQRNRVLRGPGYVAPVSYWMAVKGAIGIHDCKWRGNNFGGDIYKTNGSHGCINVPSSVMPELYDMVELGTPVVMFYGES